MVDSDLRFAESMDMYRFIIGFVIAAMMPMDAMADDVVHVPGSIAKTARFTGASGQPMMVSQGGNGARVVVGKAAMITAMLGSTIVPRQRVSETHPVRVELLAGGYLLHTGSEAVEFIIGKSTVRMRQAQMLVVQVSGNWYVKVTALFGEGVAEVLVPAPHKNVEAEPQAEVLPEFLVTVLPVGTGHRLDFERGPLRADVISKPHFSQIAGYLTPSSGNEMIIPQVDIEDPADYQAKSSKTSEMVEGVEIEDIEIEIEVDCVEICVD
jgi:hypothetical protein